MTLIYHLARQSDWEQALASSQSQYLVSTLRATLSETGYIHCSFASQVDRIADLIYAGIPNVYLLTIAPEKLESPVKVENLEGGTELFPHIYGPLNVDAVIHAGPYSRQAVDDQQ